jgi:succinate-acetate transporter protein
LVFEKNVNFFAENMHHNIDPRLGEFLPIWPLFTLGSFLKITKVAKYFGILFSTEKLCILILAKLVFGYILEDFSQTYLVTLVLGLLRVLR